MDKTATDQTIAEALRESEQRFRALVEGVAIIVWETDSTGTRMLACDAWQEITGCQLRDDVDWLAAVHPEDRDLVAQHWRSCVATQCLFTAEYRLPCPIDGWRWTQAHAAPLRDASGQITKWVGMNLDIADRKLAEQQLLKNQRHMSLALDIARIGFWSLDPLTQQVRMDGRMRNVWGETRSDELYDLEVVVNRIHPDDRPLVVESVKAALDPKGTGYYKPTDYRLILEDGSIRWIAANGMALYAGRGADRQAIELFGTVLDITPRKLTEDSLRESEERLQQLNSQLEDRVQARTQELVDSENRLRRLALALSRAEERERRHLAQILHDHVQQLLVGAKMRIEALHWPTLDHPTDEQLTGITTVLDMAINATRSLAVELVPPVLHTQGLPTALQWLAVQFSEQHSLCISVEIDAAANPTSEEARDLLYQAAREFLLNVLKHAHTHQASLKLGQTQTTLSLSVSDQGAGFVTKVASPGSTTFGLFHLRERLAALGGSLTVHSLVGHGTTVTVTLPR